MQHKKEVIATIRELLNAVEKDDTVTGIAFAAISPNMLATGWDSTDKLTLGGALGVMQIDMLGQVHADLHKQMNLQHEAREAAKKASEQSVIHVPFRGS